jgi:TolB protein
MRLLLAILILCHGTLLQAQNPLIVNIDNPNFRKLTAAIPAFFTTDDKNSELAEVGASSAQELSRLLVFSGLFNILAPAAYDSIMPGLAKTSIQEKNTILSLDPDKRGLKGIDVVQWKALGVESLTTGELGKDEGGMTLSIRTIDINRGELLIGKKYRKIKKDEMNFVMRRYADLILRAYTGKPGIFNTKLVFIGRQKKSSPKQVYISDFDGSNVIQITKEKTPHVSPVWSHDGRFLTYTSYELGAVDLFIYEVATGKKRRLSNYKGLNSGANWSPDDKLIAFTGSVEGDANIYTIDPAGGTRKALITGSGLDVDPAFSPDGKWMAFVSGRYGNPHIFRAALSWDGPKAVKVTGDLRLTYAGWYNATPAWSPDSEKIAFGGFDKDINRFDLFMMSPDGSKLERLTLRTGDNESPSWAPNGQMLAFHSNRVGDQNVKDVAQLYVMNRDGSNQRKLNTGLYEAQTPKWSAPIGE